MNFFEKYIERFPIQVSAVLKAKKNKKLAHAYIINCDNPQTKKYMPLLISQIIACPDSDNDGAPCGKCSTCIQMEKGSYPETHILTPQKKSRIIPIGKNEEDFGSIRWFESKFYLTSTTQAGVKIGILYDAESMTNEASNAFLKTLEEPPAGTFFFLATSNPSLFLPTIKSRCQILHFISNECVYDFNGSGELCSSIIQMLRSGSELEAAEECTENILKTLSGLKSEAEERIAPLWEEHISLLEEMAGRGKNSDRDSKKMLKEASKNYENAVNSEYLRLREMVNSAIHASVFHIWQIASGVDINSLPNSELISKDEIELIKKIDVSKLEKAEKHADELLKILRWSVKEELAYRNFCLQTVYEA